MRYKTVYDAAHAWVSEMVSVPLSVVEKLSAMDTDDMLEVTPPVRGDRVCVFERGSEEGEVLRYIERTNRYAILMDDSEIVSAEEEDFEVLRDDRFPMWGTLWTFSDPCDLHWMESHLRTLALCGFRVYESEDYGLLFGIDGCGYDFYSAHWIPLYQARGLHWHEEAINV